MDLEEKPGDIRDGIPPGLKSPLEESDQNYYYRSLCLVVSPLTGSVYFLISWEIIKGHYEEMIREELEVRDLKKITAGSMTAK